MSSFKKKIGNRFNSVSLKRKILLINMIVLLVPLTIFSGIIFYINKQTKIQERVKMMEFELNQTKSQIERNVEICGMTMQTVLLNKNLVAFLQIMRENDELPIQEVMAFRESEVVGLQRIMNSNPYLYSIRIYVNDDDFLEMWPSIYRDERLKRQGWVKNSYANTNGWNLNYKDEIFPDYIEASDERLAALVRPIYNIENEPIGLIEIATYMKTLFVDMYQTTPQQWTGFFDENKQLHYDRSTSIGKWQEYIEAILKTMDENEGETKIIVEKVNGENLIMGFIPIKQLGGHLIKVISLEKDFKIIDNMRNFFIIEIMVVAIVIGVILNGVVNIVLKKFYTVIKIIREVQKGNLDVKVGDYGQDEIGELAEHIKKMIHKVKYLMEDNIRRETLVKDSEIRALQNQINAHFIYNVLESIKMMAEIEGMFSLSDAVTALGKLLRYSMKWKSPKVMVQEEIEYIKNYIVLINLRFEYEIILSITMPELLWEQHIPKMSLQPIIENVIKHGVGELAQDTTIYIKGKLCDDYFYIEITDTGRGMNESELKHLRGKIAGTIQEEEIHSSGIGLRNVQERIHLCFGESYGLSVVAKSGCYTKVIVRIPFNKV